MFYYKILEEIKETNFFNLIIDTIVKNSKEIINAMQEKETQLCIGLDIRLPIEQKLNKALEIIEMTGDLAIAYKPNRQFWLGFSLHDMQTLTSSIKKQNAYAIIDHKLSDIGSTNDAALQWSKSEGFDMITISPFPGNIEDSGVKAIEYDIGLIYLLLMSNPEAEWMTHAPLSYWAKQLEKYATGMVIGLSNFTTPKLLKDIADLAPSPFVLAPGLGAQGGEVALIKKIFGNRVMYNVSRGISQSDNILKATEEYHTLISSIS